MSISPLFSLNACLHMNSPNIDKASRPFNVNNSFQSLNADADTELSVQKDPMKALSFFI